MTTPSSSRTSFRLAALASIATLVLACGDLVSTPAVGSGGGFDEATPSASARPSIALDASAAAPKDILSSCPLHPAIEGADCSALGATCEYGSSPDQRCNTTLSCEPDVSSINTWTARPSVLCPSYECLRGASAAIEGTPCALPASDGGAPADADELACPMSDGICACSTGTDPAHAHARVWVCVKPSSSCPSTRPLVGQSCSFDQTCDYGSCAFKQGMRMECKQGVWSSASASCN